MKLGLSQACYRWVFYPALRRDRPGYQRLGMPVPYWSSIPMGIEEDEAVDWLIQRCLDLDLSALYVETRLLRGGEYAREKGRYCTDHGLELIGGAGANWVATGEEADADYASFTAALRVAREAGCRLLCTTHTAAAEHNHFTRNPPIERQIERMVANFRRVVDVAEGEGLVIAFENHGDYRCREIARVVEGVDSPALRVNLDTGNPVGVFEDPVEAARAVAPYTVMMHIKDFHVQPMTTIGLPQIHWAPAGRGSIDLPGILKVVQAQAPEPETIPACLEVAPLPEHDPDLWVRDSLSWIRENLAPYLSSESPAVRG